MLQGKFLAAFHRRIPHLTDNAYLMLTRAHFTNTVDKTHDAVVTDQGTTDKTRSDSRRGRPVIVSNLNRAKRRLLADQSSETGGGSLLTKMAKEKSRALFSLVTGDLKVFKSNLCI